MLLWKLSKYFSYRKEFPKQTKYLEISPNNINPSPPNSKKFKKMIALQKNQNTLNK